jgi:hypothetical protein
VGQYGGWNDDLYNEYRSVPRWRAIVCRLIGHRPAFIVFGREACGRCGQLTSRGRS